MTALWSRVAQVRSLCRCPSCVSTISHTTRHATAAPARAKLVRPDVFTLFSSTLVLSAAILDSTKKEQRNRQWDAAIAETKADIAAEEAAQQKRLARLVSDHDLREKSEKCEKKRRPRRTWATILEIAAERERERSALGFEDWQGVPLSLLRTLSEEELVQIRSQDRLLHKFYGGPDCLNLVPEPPAQQTSAKKRKTTQWSILKLVLELLIHSHQVPWKKIDGKENKYIHKLLEYKEESAWTKAVDDIREKIKYLQTQPASSSIHESYPWPTRPRYKHQAHDDYTTSRESLILESNQILDKILRQLNAKSKIDVSWICTHLLLMQIEPNIHTYNMLLVRFSQLQQAPWVRAVLTSMLETHVRPNEITHAVLLRFFADTGDESAFKDYMIKMKGGHGGLALAHPDQPIHSLIESRIRLLHRQNTKAIQKARMNSEAYTSLIKGLVRFAYTEEAKKSYLRMIDEGWKPTAEILTAVLQNCCRLADATSSFAIWNLLSIMASNGTKIGKRVYKSMLRICLIRGEIRRGKDILRFGVTHGHLKPWVLSLRLEELDPSSSASSSILDSDRYSKHSKLKVLDSQAEKASASTRRHDISTDYTHSPYHDLVHDVDDGNHSSESPESNAKLITTVSSARLRPRPEIGRPTSPACRESKTIANAHSMTRPWSSSGLRLVDGPACWTDKDNIRQALTL